MSRILSPTCILIKQSTNNDKKINIYIVLINEDMKNTSMNDNVNNCNVLRYYLPKIPNSVQLLNMLKKKIYKNCLRNNLK